MSRVYFDINKYGWIYFFFSTILLFLMQDAASYYYHRSVKIFKLNGFCCYSIMPMDYIIMYEM